MEFFFFLVVFRNFNKILSSSVALDSTPLQRLEAVNDKLEELEESFIIKNRSFRQQFANLYFARLTQLKPAVLKVARNRWSSLPGNYFDHEVRF